MSAPSCTTRSPRTATSPLGPYPFPSTLIDWHSKSQSMVTGPINDASPVTMTFPSVSALIVAMVFLAPFLRYIQGGNLEKGPLGSRTQATLATSLHSIIGMEDFVRVQLEPAADGGYVARPVFGKSSMLSTMARANGIIIVPARAEGLVQGAAAEVIGI